MVISKGRRTWRWGVVEVDQKLIALQSVYIRLKSVDIKRLLEELPC